jgi:hypothetical protein
MPSLTSLLQFAPQLTTPHPPHPRVRPCSELFETSLLQFALDLTHDLDAQFHLRPKTVVSLRDVPGLTRATIPIFVEVGCRPWGCRGAGGAGRGVQGCRGCRRGVQAMGCRPWGAEVQGVQALGCRPWGAGHAQALACRLANGSRRGACGMQQLGG